MFSLPQWQSALANLRSLHPAWLWGVSSREQAATEEASVKPSFYTPRLLWVLYGTVVFVIFLFLTFPTELALQRVTASIAQTAQLRIQYGSGRWTWNKGWVLYDLTIEKPGATPPLHLSRLAISPSWLGLLHGQPLPLSFSATLYGGAATGSVRQDNAGFGVQFTLDAIDLALWPFPQPFRQGNVSGNLTVEGTFQGMPAEINSWTGSMTASLSDGASKGGALTRSPLPALRAVQARLRATLQNSRLEVADGALSVDGLEAHLQGNITLRLPLVWSVLDLQLTTRVTGAPPPTLVSLNSLLSAVPGAAGERRATITGSVATPAMR